MKRNKSERNILAQYDAQGTYTVITFRGGRRVMTYGGLDSLEAIKFAHEQTLVGHEVLVFQKGELTVSEECEWDKSFFVSKILQMRFDRNKETA